MVLLSTTAMHNYFLTFVDESDFDRCVAKVKRMGFKQQAHFVIEKIREFLFWSLLEINIIAKPDGYKNKDLLVRNNVVNGYGSLGYLKQNETRQTAAPGYKKWWKKFNVMEGEEVVEQEKVIIL